MEYGAAHRPSMYSSRGRAFCGCPVPRWGVGWLLTVTVSVVSCERSLCLSSSVSWLAATLPFLDNDNYDVDECQIRTGSCWPRAPRLPTLATVNAPTVSSYLSSLWSWGPATHNTASRSSLHRVAGSDELSEAHAGRSGRAAAERLAEYQ